MTEQNLKPCPDFGRRTMKFKVTYIQGGNQVIEYCLTQSFAKKRARQTRGTWAKL